MRTVPTGAAGTYFIAIAIFFFAFTSIIGNYSYAENALTFLGAGNRLGLTIMRCATLVMVVWGAYESIATVFDAADGWTASFLTWMNQISLSAGCADRLLRSAIAVAEWR